VQADFFEIIHTTRAMRRLKPDPVPNHLIQEILRAGISAPNGANHQNWAFLVVTDPGIKKQIQVFYERAFEEEVKPNYFKTPPPPGMTMDQKTQQLALVEHLTRHFHEAPVWIVACRQDGERVSRTAGAGIYPAVQNMLLAARALGLGATLTTRHTHSQAESDAIFGLPGGWHSFAILPIGYPVGRFGPTRRGPLSGVVHGNRFGEPAPFAIED
jgi:nitroreductase